MLLADVPLDPGRDEARDAAVRELSDPAYADAGPNALEQAVNWVLERLGSVLAGLGAGVVTPVAMILLLVVLVALVLIIRYWRGRAVRNVASIRNVFDRKDTTADEHRRAAQEAAAAGEFAEAIRERFRALVRELEQRGVLEPRAGRTVDEVALEAGRALPALADDLRGAAVSFDDVWYGGRTATSERYEELVSVDDRVRV
ncbi:DUF4129 domain-containing protein [Lentzea alba]|uniref:DUF4129 domain-containing protein n=1 Tax=Lentzea alba TaxID=2714351 RepID=UPI0039BFE586